MMRRAACLQFCFVDRRAAVSLELALVFPVFLLFVFGLFSAYDMVVAKRAMDVGVQRALRYAIVNGGAGAAEVKAVYTTWAGLVAGNVAARSVVTVTPAAVGGRVSIVATYAWAAPATLGAGPGTAVFTPITLTSQAVMRVMH